MLTLESAQIEYLTLSSISDAHVENDVKSVWNNSSSVSVLLIWTSAAQYTSASPASRDETAGPINDAMANLRATVEVIKSHRTFIPRSTSFEALLEQAASLQGIPSNIPDWAQQLAKDVSDLDD